MVPHFNIFSNLLPKTAILIMVATFWALITSRQGQIITVAAPVRMHGVPEGLALVRSSPEEVDVQLKSFSILTPMPSKLDITADVDLSAIREGQAIVRIKNSDFKLPSGMEMMTVNPPTIRVVTDRKKRKSVPIKVTWRGRMGRGMELVADPATVEVEGPAGQVERIEKVATEEVYVGNLLKGRDYYKNLVPPNNNVNILRNEPIIVRLTMQRKK